MVELHLAQSTSGVEEGAEAVALTISESGGGSQAPHRPGAESPRAPAGAVKVGRDG